MRAKHQAIPLPAKFGRALFLALALSLLALGGSAQADTQRVEVRIGGLNRHYDLFVPNGGKNYPLLLVFHGGLGSPELMRRITGLEATAQREGFAVAFMAGTGPSSRLLVWNAGGCCASAMRSDVDEVAYVRAAIEQITNRHPVDRRRIYLTGHSNGAMLVQVLAERTADQIAAAAVVGGPRFKPVPAGPPVPMLVIHAIGDPAAPFAGGYSEKRLVRNAMSAPFLPVREGAEGWAKRDQCRSSSVKKFAGYEVTDYSNCAGGAKVTFVSVDTDQHAWFGGARSANSTINATSMTWNFLKKFSK